MFETITYRLSIVHGPQDRAYVLPALCEMMDFALNKLMVPSPLTGMRLAQEEGARKLIYDLRTMGCSPSSVYLATAHVPVEFARLLGVLRGELGQGPCVDTLLAGTRILVREAGPDLRGDLTTIFLKWHIRWLRQDVQWFDAELMDAAFAAVSADDYDALREIARP